LSPILKYQLAIDIQVISTLGGAANAVPANAAQSAAASETMSLRFIIENSAKKVTTRREYASSRRPALRGSA
jgi:hypothetical protein